MDKVSIIIRCRNRLEYTTQVLNAVKLNTNWGNYEIILIDNASTDGTEQWIKWMQVNTNWYAGTLKYLKLDRNHGDWGGMLIGLTCTSVNSKYIVQLDNDIIPEKNWLTSMITVLNKTKYGVVMLKRENVAWKLKCLGQPIKLDGLQICHVERPVACYMMEKNLFAKIARRIPEKMGSTSKYIIAKNAKIAKILNVKCIELEAPFQRNKYNPKNKQIWEKV